MKKAGKGERVVCPAFYLLGQQMGRTGMSNYTSQKKEKQGTERKLKSTAKRVLNHFFTKPIQSGSNREKKKKAT